MKISTFFASTALACSFGIAAPVLAQQPAQEYRFDSQDGRSPASTLRITEQPLAVPTPAVRDTPESLKKYTRCRNNADREAVDRMQLQTMVATCLYELEQRRQP